MAATPDAAWKATYYELDGLTLAHISATYWLNGLRMPEDQQWLVQLLDKDEILAIAARSRRMGADVVVVSIHCCIEYQANPTEAQRQLNHDLIESDDVDLVVGHHSHVVGPIERVGGEYIVHGLGNFISAQSQFPAPRDGVVAIANLEQSNGKWEVVGIDVVPTWVEPGTYRVLRAARANPASFERTMAAVTSYRAPGVKEFQWTRTKTRLASLREWLEPWPTKPPRRRRPGARPRGAGSVIQDRIRATLWRQASRRWQRPQAAKGLPTCEVTGQGES